MEIIRIILTVLAALNIIAALIHLAKGRYPYTTTTSSPLLDVIGSAAAVGYIVLLWQ